MAIDQPNRSEKTGGPGPDGMARQRRWLVFGSNVAVAILLATILAAAVVWLSVALLRGQARTDWTAAGRFSLSPRTKAMLKNLPESVTEVRLTSLYSPASEVPDTQERWQRVHDLLAEFGTASTRVTAEDVSATIDPGGVEKLIARLRQRYAAELAGAAAQVQAFKTLHAEVGQVLQREATRLGEAAAAWENGPIEARRDLATAARTWQQLGFIGSIAGANIEALMDEALPAYSSALSQTTGYLTQARQQFEQAPTAFERIRETAKDAPLPPAVKDILDSAKETYEPLAKRIEAFEKMADAAGPREYEAIRGDINQKDPILIETFANKGVIRVRADDEGQLKTAAKEAGAEKVVKAVKAGADEGGVAKVLDGVFDVITKADQLEAVKTRLAEKSFAVAEAEVRSVPDKIQVVSFSDVWVFVPPAEGQTGAPQYRFKGDTAISSTLLAMVSEEKVALVFVTSGGPATAAMPGMPGMERGMRGPYVEMAERLRKANFIVEDWHVAPGAEMPKPEGASKVVLVLVPPAPRNPQMPMPPPSPDQYQPVIDAITGGAPAIVMADPATMFQQPAPYANLYDVFGVEAKFNAVAVRNVVVDSAGREKAFAEIEITRYAKHPVTKPLGALPAMFLNASPLIVRKDLAEGLTAEPLVEMPGGPDYWADTVVFEALRNQATRDDAEDIAGPVPLGVAAERQVGGQGQRVVLFGSSLFARDGVAFHRVPVGHADQTMSMEVRFPGNAELFVNACLWASGQDHLIAASPEALEARRIGDVGAWQLPIQIVVIVGLPAIVLVVGVLVYVIRRG